MNGEKRLRTFVMAVCCVAFAMTVWGEMPVLTPADGKDVVEVHDLVDDLIAFTNYSRTAEIVAFDRLPRANVLHSWKGLGVTVLKTVRFEREGTAEHFRRQVGFLAFQSGVDGEFRTPASDNMVYQNLPAIAFGFPMMLLATLAPDKPILTLIILAVYCIALNIILFRKQLFRKKRK